MTKSSEFSETLTNLVGISSYEAGITQASAFRAIKKYTDAALMPYGITTTQWFIVGAVYDRGGEGISITELSQIIGTNLPFVTNSANVLEKLNMLTRSVHDTNHRSKVLRIHPDFQKTVPKIEAVVREKLRDTIYSTVSREDFLTYIRVLYTFHSQLK